MFTFASFILQNSNYCRWDSIILSVVSSSSRLAVMVESLHGKLYFLFPDVLKRWSFRKNRAGIFLVLLGKIMFLFLENMILTLGGKWKMIFFKKIQGNIILFSGLPKRRSFQEGPRRDMIFLVLSGKMVFFSRKHDIFFPWAGSQRQPFARNTWKYDIFCVHV